MTDGQEEGVRILLIDEAATSRLSSGVLFNCAYDLSGGLFHDVVPSFSTKYLIRFASNRNITPRITESLRTLCSYCVLCLVIFLSLVKGQQPLLLSSSGYRSLYLVLLLLFFGSLCPPLLITCANHFFAKHPVICLYHSLRKVFDLIFL